MEQIKDEAGNVVGLKRPNGVVIEYDTPQKESTAPLTTDQAQSIVNAAHDTETGAGLEPVPGVPLDQVA